MTDQHAKVKRGYKKASLKTFGNFFAMHMVKKLITKRGKSTDNEVTQKHHDQDAIDAGFSNASSCENNLLRHESVNSSNMFSVGVTKSYHGVDLDSVKTTPGVFGLVNHGNTCYINAIVQCLSNTDSLAEYFVMGHYKADIKNCHKERSKKYGTKGEVTESLAIVIRNLWTGTYTQDMTKQLKESVGKFASQYKGNTQHDSQEFLLWLFDKLHEDLNQYPIKKFPFSKKQSFYRSSSQKRNKRISDASENFNWPSSSFIQKVFQGQYQSSLTCRNCKKQSNTKDPFLCVSLPIKQRTTNPVYVNVAFLSNRRKSGLSSKSFGKFWKIAVPVQMEGKIYDLRQAVASECGIHSRLLAFVEVQEDGFHSSYGDNCNLSDIPAISSNSSSNSTLFAFEMPHIAKLTAGTLPRNFASRYNKHHKAEKHSMKSSHSMQDSIVILLINKIGVKDQGKRFGSPHVFRINRDVTLTELQSTILLVLSNSIKNGVKQEKLSPLFSIQIVDGLANKSCISNNHQPLLLPTVDKALENCPVGGPLHIKLNIEWEKDVKSIMLDKVAAEKVEVQESVRLQRLLHQQPLTCTLEECFDMYTQVERLASDDTWHCPHCRKQQHGTEKKLSLQSLPDVLVLHLKRFRVFEGKRTKLCTRVEFPVTGLDISKHVCQDSTIPASPPGIWKSNDANKHFHGEEYLYDLYAVCNHFGSLNSGHYTACCSNPLNGKWYQYDDNNTEVIQEQDLSTQSAYILFYQRRSVSAALSCGGMSNNSIMSDHWAFNLPQYKQKVQFNSQSHLNTYSVYHGSTDPALNSIVSNCNKIDAVVSDIKVGTRQAEKDDDEGGFDAAKKPYVRGLQRQSSAVLRKSVNGQRNGELRGRQYRSYRGSRSKLRQQTSPV